MTDETQKAWACPKDGTEMAPIGRRSGAWRCPSCKAVFIDVEAMRRGRAGKQPVWARVLMNVVISVTAIVFVRRLLRRSKA